MRTIVYIDGFNLYYRQLKRQPQYRWLNIKALSDCVLSPQNDVVAVKFYTAHVSAKIKQGAKERQDQYLAALGTIPEVSLHMGNFLIGKKWAKLIQPHNSDAIMQPWPEVVKVRKIEEKGSDVNLGVHLVRDAFKDEFDVAAVLSNDTDLVEPIRIVTEELGKPVGLICPVSKPATGLKDVASFIRHIRADHLRRSQFPDDIAGTSLSRPQSWCVADISSV